MSTCPKSQDNNLNILRMERAFKMKYKVFFIIFEGLSLKQINFFFERWEPDFNLSFAITQSLGPKKDRLSVPLYMLLTGGPEKDDAWQSF